MPQTTLRALSWHLASFTGGLPHATVVVGDVLNLTSYVPRFGGDTVDASDIRR